MTGSLAALAAAVIVFVGGHFLVASALVRGPLVARVGERAFGGLYSLLALIPFVWMLMAYSRAPVVPVWSPPLWAHWVPILVMPFALLLFVGSVTQRNPTLGMQGFAAAAADPAPGMLKVTRHPMLWGFALWALAHLAANGDAASILLFGGIAVLALAGMPVLDAKRRGRDPAGFARFAAATSILPLAALSSGRAQLRFRDIGWWRIGLAAVLYAALFSLHPFFSGMPIAV